MEHSAGFIIYRTQNGEIEFLLLKNRAAGHWGFPKGHLESGENKLTAATRELAEETGIKTCIPEEGFQETIQYEFQNGSCQISKTVTWFLGRVDTISIRLSNEHNQHCWRNLKKAKELISFPDLQRLLDKAYQFISRK